MKLACSGCDAVQDPGYKPVSDCCGSMTNPVYDLGKVRLSSSHNPFKRYLDLLPVRDVSLLPEEAAFTPLVRAKKLGKALGLPRSYLKNETVLPTGTAKYRMASVALPYMYENGVRHFCTSSTGKSSSAYGHLIPGTPELRVTLSGSFSRVEAGQEIAERTGKARPSSFRPVRKRISSWWARGVSRRCSNRFPDATWRPFP